jgi:glycosyltransferase involved in cell wall biosynthesis
MTQVVNEYLSWTFPTYDQGFLASRGAGAARTTFLFIGAVARILTLPRTERVVVVHLSQGGSFVREGFLVKLARARRIPVVAHLHGSRFVSFSRRRPRLVRRVLARADAVTVLSEPTRVAVRALLPDAFIALVPNAVAAGRSTAERPVVVFGGAVTRRKGVDVLAAAWERLGATTNGWELVIAGPVAEPDLIAALPTGARSTGALPRVDMRDLLAGAAIAVLPSRDEAMPLFVLEALASSTAVVATDVGGVAAVLDGAGIVVPAGDIDALAEALRGLIESPDARGALARAGLERWRSTYSPEVIAPRLEAVWNAARAVSGT